MSNIEEIFSFWDSLAEYELSGEGSVTCEHGNSSACQLRLRQLLNGCIAIEIITNNELKCESQRHFMGTLLQDGSVLSDWQVEVTGIKLNHSVLLAPDLRTWIYLGTADRCVTTDNIRNLLPECRKILCGLTNIYLGRLVELEIDGLQLKLGRRKGVDQTYLKAQTMGSSAVLGELWIASDVSLLDNDWDKILERLCFLLSLAHRNDVRKAFKVLYDFEDQVCGKVLYGSKAQFTRATKRQLISTDDLPEFLRKTFPSYVPELYFDWKLEAATEHYFRAFDNDSAWPMGVEIALALECLVSAYTSKAGGEFHFTDEIEEFDPLRKQIAKMVLSFLESHFPERVKYLRANNNEKQSWVKGLRGLNRRSFKQKIRSMVEGLGIEAPKSEILQDFVDIRNDLVHYGYPRSQDWSLEFRKIINMAEFLDKVFLAVLKYKGPIQKLQFRSS